MIPNQTEYEICGMGQTRFFSSRYLSKMQTELSKKYPVKLYHISLPTLKRGFNGLRRLSDSQIIPLEIPIALYQTRRNGIVGEEQYQIIQQNPTSFLYKYWTARKLDNNAIFTKNLPTKTTFDGCIAK